jgi:hypothetical protein
MPSRVPYFECVFVADRNEYRFHFRCPSAEEAERHLCEELREWGLAVAGEVRVMDARGRVVRRTAYDPPLDGGHEDGARESRG